MDPAEEAQWGGPEEVAESAPAQAGPNDVEEGEQGEDEEGDAPVVGFGAIGGDEFCVLSEAGDEPDWEGDEPGADDEAAGDGGFTDADEAGPEAAGLGDLATGVDEVTEAEEIEDGDGGEQGESDDEGEAAEGGIESGADLADGAGPPGGAWCGGGLRGQVAGGGDGGDLGHGDGCNNRLACCVILPVMQIYRFQIFGWGEEPGGGGRRCWL